MRIKFVFVALFLVLIPVLTFSQTNQSDSLSFTTYFPSPNAVFNKMEVKSKLVVGNLTGSTTITNMNNLKQDQVFVTDSIILGTQNSRPAPYPGEIFFNNTSKKLEVNNGTWQQLGS